MNLRIEGQQMRFRISTKELEILCSGSSITQPTYFPKMRALDIDITPQDIEPVLQLIFDGDCMVLAVQNEAAQDLYHALPGREGLAVTQTINAVQTLELILEVDIRTQKRQRRDHAS
jgi:hypothetical protein